MNWLRGLLTQSNRLQLQLNECQKQLDGCRKSHQIVQDNLDSVLLRLGQLKVAMGFTSNAPQATFFLWAKDKIKWYNEALETYSKRVLEWQEEASRLQEQVNTASHQLHQTEEALYLAQGLDSPEARRRQDIFDKYRFTPKAQLACRLYSLHFNSGRLGTSHHEMAVFFPDAEPSDEGLVHELSHVQYWCAKRFVDGVKTEEFIKAAWEEAANVPEHTPLWEYRYGEFGGGDWHNMFWRRNHKKAWEPWKGPGFSWSPFTAVVNDEELYAGLASWCMSDKSKLPEALKLFYAGLFQ